MKKIEREINACQDLLAHYQGKIILNHCPLCELCENPVSRILDCEKCLWIRFEKIDCFAYRDELQLKHCVITYRYNPRISKRWTQSRIKMLKRWIRLLKKAKAGQ